MPVFGSTDNTIGLSQTAEDLIEATRYQLLSGQIEDVNQLGAPMANTDGAFSLAFPVGATNQRGRVLSIGLEDIRVWATDGANRVTQCDRGVNGTSATAHNKGDLVNIGTKFSSYRILRAINADIADLSSPLNGMYQVLTTTLTYSPVVRGYDLSGVASIIRVLEVRYNTPGPSKNWPELRSWSLQRNMPASTFPSGLVLDLNERAFPGLPVIVRYAAPYGQLVNLTDDVQGTTGLQLTAFDIPVLGAAIRLVYPREIKRNFTEAGGEPRRAEEVPSGGVMRSAAGLATLRSQRIRAEASALSNQWPYLQPVM